MTTNGSCYDDLFDDPTLGKIPLPCPRCNGRLFIEGHYRSCVNCGYEEEIRPEPIPITDIDWTQIKNQWSIKRAE